MARTGTGEHIVIAIDFGTTYSAVAWASSTEPGAIDVVDGWPTRDQQPLRTQVPSEIAYDDQTDVESRTFSWGYNLGPRDQTIRCFKLGLETDGEGIDLPSGMDIVSVTRDYLSAVHVHAMNVISRRLPREVFENAQFSYALTVPAIWTDSMKEKTRLAALEAGLAAGIASNLTLYSEPESAAIYTLQTIEWVMQHVEIGDRIVVCDAGGGTVDLISYDIERIDPSLQLVESSIGSGEYCGSTFIDREFESLFQQRLGPAYDGLSVLQKQMAVKNFETSKIAFWNDRTCSKFYVNIPGIDTISEAGIHEGFFELSRLEMKSLFDPIVSQVLDLIQQQVTAQQSQVKFILLVGGFGESRYLHSRIHSWARMLDIQVLQPRDAAMAIVKGAIMKELEQRKLLTGQQAKIDRRARRSYGVIICDPFDSGQHLETDAIYETGSQRKLARCQVHWFITANQLVKDDETFRKQIASNLFASAHNPGCAFSRTFAELEPWRDILVSSELSTPPIRVNEHVHRLCVMYSDLTQLDNWSAFKTQHIENQEFYTAEYDLVLSLKHNNLNLSLSFAGREYGLVNVEFDSQPVH